MAIFALDGPEFAFVSLCDDVDALVSVGEFEFSGGGLRDFATQPDVLEFAGVFRIKLEVSSDELFEQVAFLFLREATPLVLDVLP